jgi:excinuclease UvrABC ATPase subunit
MIEALMTYFKTTKPEDFSNNTPEGFCPNCWGTQEYSDKIRVLYEDKQIDVNNHKAHYAFIQDFVVTHLKGIHLIKGNNSFECPTCHTKYPINHN